MIYVYIVIKRDDVIEMNDSRPLLKGKIHLIALISYLSLFPILIRTLPKNIRFYMIFYLLAEIGHFGASTLLHIINWVSWLDIMRKIDHIMIFPKIISTYYAITSTVLPDIHPLVLKIVNISSLLGILSRVLFTDASKIMIAIPYFLTGWAVLLDPKIFRLLFQRLKHDAWILILSGVLYSIGGIIYIRKKPNLIPGYLEYHELFHIFSVLGAASVTKFIFQNAIPYYKNI